MICRSGPDSHTPQPLRQQEERQTDAITSYVLRGGVLLSTAIILLGVVIYTVRDLVTSGHASLTSGIPRSLDAVVAGSVHGDPVAITALGLLVLLATPTVRVAVSIVAFWVERDWRYVVITSVVLGILLLSFFVDRGGT
ncbi:MAG TPA: DUF1634 domain-containing protein [Ktedonobacterales bacterium]